MSETKSDFDLEYVNEVENNTKRLIKILGCFMIISFLTSVVLFSFSSLDYKLIPLSFLPTSFLISLVVFIRCWSCLNATSVSKYHFKKQDIVKAEISLNNAPCFGLAKGIKTDKITTS